MPKHLKRQSEREKLMTIQLLETCEDDRGAFLLVADHIAALLNGDVEVCAFSLLHMFIFNFLSG